MNLTFGRYRSLCSLSRPNYKKTDSLNIELYSPCRRVADHKIFVNSLSSLTKITAPVEPNQGTELIPPPLRHKKKAPRREPVFYGGADCIPNEPVSIKSVFCNQYLQALKPCYA